MFSSFYLSWVVPALTQEEVFPGDVYLQEILPELLLMNAGVVVSTYFRLKTRLILLSQALYMQLFANVGFLFPTVATSLFRSLYRLISSLGNPPCERAYEGMINFLGREINKPNSLYDFVRCYTSLFLSFVLTGYYQSYLKGELKADPLPLLLESNKPYRLDMPPLDEEGEALSVRLSILLAGYTTEIFFQHFTANLFNLPGYIPLVLDAVYEPLRFLGPVIDVWTKVLSGHVKLSKSGLSTLVLASSFLLVRHLAYVRRSIDHPFS